MFLSGYNTVENCFLRCQDDCIYTGSGSSGLIVNGLTTWTDFNGSAFIFTAGGSGHTAIVSNCDVIFSRSKFAFGNGAGGRTFCLRTLKSGASIRNIHFSDIRIDDPNRNEVFYILAQDRQPAKQSKPKNEGWILRNSQGDYFPLGPDQSHVFQNITFKNIEIVQDLGRTSKVFGSGKDYDMTFENITIGGKKAKNAEDLYLNVVNFDGIKFIK